MKKVTILLFFVLSVLQTNAQRFRPFSYDELAAPAIAAQRYHNQCCQYLIQLMESAQEIEAYISKAKDPICWSRYCNYYNSVVDEYKNINKNGVDRGTEQRISNLKTKFSVINAIMSAYNKRSDMANDQYRRLQSSPNIRCDKFYMDFSVDAFLDGKTPRVNYTY